MSEIEPTVELHEGFSEPNAKARPYAEVVEVLTNSEMFWLSSVRRDGRPHLTPLPAIWLGRALHFCAGAHGGMLMIGPHSEVKGPNEMPGRIMINFETQDVKREFDRLKALGATVQQEPYQPGPAGGEMWLATLADPDGNYFQLTSPMPAQ